jgi:hypothetical protein
MVIDKISYNGDLKVAIKALSEQALKVLGELGRFPLTVLCQERALKYWNI